MKFKDNKKYIPIKPQPEDEVETIYCDDSHDSYENIKYNDMFPYASPIPQPRRTPEPPII